MELTKGDVMFCIHKWTVLSEKRIEGELEVAAKHSMSIKGYEPKAAVHITICTCAKCGDIKKFETRG